MPYSRAKRPADRVKTMWPDLRYHPVTGEAKLFHKEEDVPDDWLNKAGDRKVLHTAPVELNRDELITKLKERGIEINPIWGNGHMKRILDGDSGPTR
jgi:hypothetical protein